MVVSGSLLREWLDKITSKIWLLFELCIVCQPKNLKYASCSTSKKKKQCCGALEDS